MSYCACPECSKPLQPSAQRTIEPTEPERAAVYAKLQSPLEVAFLEAFTKGQSVTWSRGRAHVGAFWLEPQVRIGPFSTDFAMGLVIEGRWADVAVELDGHEFHQKTPEQVEHDRRRDRAFVRMGAVVLRFTGREVSSNASACVTEVQLLLQQWLERMRER